MDDDAPLELHRETVHADWIDYNGHMNVAYYLLVFDHATDALLDRIGLGADYARIEGRSVFVLEAHLTYERELTAGDPVRISTRVLAADGKRFQVFHEMFHADEGFLAATNELMLMHVDLAERRSVPLPEPVARRLADLVDRHAVLPRPRQVGRVIGMSGRVVTEP